MNNIPSNNLPFIDLESQQKEIKNGLNNAINKVLSHGIFIMGPEVKKVEEEIANLGGANYCLSCGSGTDALTIPLMASNIGRGDTVFVPSFTFTSSAEVVALRGAIPFFVDINDRTFNMDPENLEIAIKQSIKAGGNPKAIITVDLFGQPADFDAINTIAEKYKLWILDDAAQSFGATYKKKPIGSFGRVTATSFYPSKPLGCYGDGGAILTNDKELFNKMDSIRVHGYESKTRYSTYLGLTSRFDSIQAAILLEKLKIFDKECKKRNIIAEKYSSHLKDFVKTPLIIDDARSVWAQYTIISKDRDKISSFLSSKGIPTALFYPYPLHLQKPYIKYPIPKNGLPNTERLSREVLSLPIHPYLNDETQDKIISSIQQAIKA